MGFLLGMLIVFTGYRIINDGDDIDESKKKLLSNQLITLFGYILVFAGVGVAIMGAVNMVKS